MEIIGDSFLGVRALSAKSARASLSAALPQLYHPLSGFRTLSAVCSRPRLVALFHATSAHRISVFRAFPSPSAAIPLGTRCSPVVTPAFPTIERFDSCYMPLPYVHVHPANKGADFRALIQRRIRTWCRGVIPSTGRCSLDLSPFKACWLDC